MDLKEILSLLNAEWVNEAETSASASSRSIEGIAELADAGKSDLSFFFSAQYKMDAAITKAGLVVTGKDFVVPIQKSGAPIWKHTPIFAVADPYFSFAVATGWFAQKRSSESHLENAPNGSIHPTAVIHPTSKIAKTAVIREYCSIEAGVVVGEGVVLYPFVYVGKNSTIGEGSVLFSRATVYENVTIGKKCRIHAGVALGADGFGYAPQLQEVEGKKIPIHHQKIHHFGGVKIGDDVEIGANSNVDRGTLRPTVIGSHSKIDDHVHVGHNCEIGEGTILCGQVALAGSVKLGKFVTIGGKSAVTNQIHIGDYAKVGGYSAVGRDIPAHGIELGIPSRDLKENYRLIALWNRQLKESKKDRRSSHE